jgi:hypothetical protein
MHVVLRKRRSRRVVYDQHYHLDAHGLRELPATKPGAARFFVFIGCSYTLGEGVKDSETFANRIVAGSNPAAGFNLGMGAYGPQEMLVLLEQGPKDFRLSGIRGSDGTAIYTFIDDHIARLLGSVSFVRRFSVPRGSEQFALEGGRLVNKGRFDTARRWTNILYQLLGYSATFAYFRQELPRFGPYHARLLAKVVADMRDILRKQYGVGRFVFSVYPGERIYISRLRPELEREGIEIFDFSSVDLPELFRGREHLFGDLHPSPEAHRFYADLVLRELQRRPRRGLGPRENLDHRFEAAAMAQIAPKLKAPGESDPAWYRCRKSLDCVVAFGFCGNPVGVNKRFRAEFEASIHSSPPRACSPAPEGWSEWRSRVVARCASGRCALFDPQAASKTPR